MRGLPADRSRVCEESSSSGSGSGIDIGIGIGGGAATGGGGPMNDAPKTKGFASGLRASVRALSASEDIGIGMVIAVGIDMGIPGTTTGMGTGMLGAPMCAALLNWSDASLECASAGSWYEK